MVYVWRLSSYISLKSCQYIIIYQQATVLNLVIVQILCSEWKWLPFADVCKMNCLGLDSNEQGKPAVLSQCINVEKSLYCCHHCSILLLFSISLVQSLVHYATLALEDNTIGTSTFFLFFLFFFFYVHCFHPNLPPRFCDSFHSQSF